MITCHRSHLEARCRERGYTLSEVMPCVSSQAGDMWTIDETHPRYPAKPKHPPPLGLGDRVAAGLKAVGITPELVSKVTGRPCGCKQRQQRLNEIGARFGFPQPLPPPSDPAD